MHATLDKEEGTYGSKLVVGWQTSKDVRFVSYTVNGLMPTLSDYVAYDTLTPPNPFIAVTQDSRGNVVYDGGFPKFYNNVGPKPTDKFADLNAAFKFLHNALNFVSNKAKTNAGNKKILILGDAVATSAYAVKGTGASSFFTSFTNLFTIAGYVPVFKDISDYASTLNPTAAELDEYCAILLMSSNYATPTGVFTPAAVAAVVAFREAGNGVILITDHGEFVTDVNVAATGSYLGFFRTANQLATEFGTYFTGLYDRSPVNVGFLRSTYGDHPLYNGMTNDEFIYAGASESQVVVQRYPRYAPNAIPPISMTDGCYLVQILTVLNDGTIEINRQTICIDLSGAARVKIRRLYIRETSSHPWLVNFSKGGWTIYKNGKPIKMLPTNTKMWDAGLKEWVYVK